MITRAVSSIMIASECDFSVNKQMRLHDEDESAELF